MKDDMKDAARRHYEETEGEGKRLYDLQLKEHKEALANITGGMSVERFLAEREAEATRHLAEIRRMLKDLPRRLARGQLQLERKRDSIFERVMRHARRAFRSQT